MFRASGGGGRRRLFPDTPERAKVPLPRVPELIRAHPKVLAAYLGEDALPPVEAAPA